MASHIGRRKFLATLGGAVAAWPLAARAQQSGRLQTIGFLGPNTHSVASEWLAAFVQRLRELGWIEGRTIAIEYRWAEGRKERAAEIAAEFARLKVDVIVTQSTPGVLAAKQATSVIPIVFASAGDPVGTGVVASLARPGGNITGLSGQATDTAAKRLELLREVVPNLRRLAIMSESYDRQGAGSNDPRIVPTARRQGDRMMKRREFITLLDGAAAWPLAARRQQPAMPVVGFLHPSSPEPFRVRAFRQGLKDAGFIEGENVAVEYRWADDQIDRLPALATELVQRRVAVIAAGGTPSILAVKAATTTTPIVFFVAEDPVRLGHVASLARPGGNLTGINVLSIELAAKRLELLRELVPSAVRIAVLVNPANATNTESILRGVEPAARSMGLQIQVLNASAIREIDAAFATLVRERPDALFVAPDPFLIDRRVQLALLALLHRVPAIYQDRLNAEAGGLMSYGPNLGDAYRHIGVYTGRILKGAKPADLPVVQSSKFELVINASTARMLGLTVPDKLLAAADEVIE